MRMDTLRAIYERRVGCGGNKIENGGKRIEPDVNKCETLILAHGCISKRNQLVKFSYAA